MKILHIINTLKTGGAEKMLTEIVPLMNKAGYEVDVLSFIGGETHFAILLKDKGIKVFNLFKSGSTYNPLIIIKLIKYVRQYDIIHTHNTSPQLFTAFVSILLRKHVFITTEHSTDNRRRKNRLLKYLDKWMYSRYNRIISISDQVYLRLANYLPKLSNKISTIYNGIDLVKYKNASPLQNIDRKRFIVCMVAGFRYQKDHETLIKAFSLLDKKHYELWLIGDGEKRSSIENLIKENELCSNVKLLGIRQDVPSILKSVDVVVQSSHIEGFGLAAVEGMASGKPVIASDVPGLREVVRDAGVLVPHKDAESLAKIIESLYVDPKLYRKISTRCFNRSKEYNIVTTANNYIETYKSVLKENEC